MPNIRKKRQLNNTLEGSSSSLFDDTQCQNKNVSNKRNDSRNFVFETKRNTRSAAKKTLIETDKVIVKEKNSDILRNKKYYTKQSVKKYDKVVESYLLNSSCKVIIDDTCLKESVHSVTMPLKRKTLKEAFDHQNLFDVDVDCKTEHLSGDYSNHSPISSKFKRGITVDVHLDADKVSHQTNICALLKGKYSKQDDKDHKLDRAQNQYLKLKVASTEDYDIHNIRKSVCDTKGDSLNIVNIEKSYLTLKPSLPLKNQFMAELKDINYNFETASKKDSAVSFTNNDTNIDKNSDPFPIKFVSLAAMRKIIPIEEFTQLRKSFSFNNLKDEKLRCLIFRAIINEFNPIEIVRSNYSLPRKSNSLSPMQMRSSPHQTSKGMINVDTSVGDIESSKFGALKCLWLDCNCQFDEVENLSTHVEKKHLSHLLKTEVYVCLWEGCKFYDQPSCSWKWLSKHVTRHCDLKPFKCVINGCDMAFVTQNGLARHVPTHFNEGKVRRSYVQKLNGLTDDLPERFNRVDSDDLFGSSLDTDDETNLQSWKQKLQKENYVKFVNRKRPVQKDDPIDQATFQKIKGHLQDEYTNTAFGFHGDSLKLRYKIIGRRESTDKTEVMFHSYPENIFSDSWIKAKKTMKPGDMLHSIPVTKLSHQQKCELYSKSSLCIRQRKSCRKETRKLPY